MELADRVKKTASLFNDNIKLLKGVELSKEEIEILKLAEMYCSDSESFARKGDQITAFSAIEYAHGLLDAVLRIKGKDPYESNK